MMCGWDALPRVRRGMRSPRPSLLVSEPLQPFTLIPAFFVRLFTFYGRAGAHPYRRWRPGVGWATCSAAFITI